eukprot:CAMPEP_0181064456 /NCGR_PEP_ID=MMETSP1070-20121207/24209_1 /TAXON_ID=265543 /ORGANISM="Minutocellus polymorphus, Strain NH13" /LENGTH=146 /DNA_ID=CAMNT_0023144769 /DNA_START=198 /DNA_END=634 /DNA_ORIENTATION=+
MSSPSGNNADQTSNRVYIKSDEDGWVPAKLISHDADGATATVSVWSYADQNQIQSDGDNNASESQADQNHIQSDGDGPSQHVTGTHEVTVDLSAYAGRVLPLQNVGEDGTLREVADMVDLPFLHEAAILYNLKARHVASTPYTRTG